MIRILSAKQIKELDAHTIAQEPIASINLMERASRAFVNWFIEKFDVTHRVAIICGTGNNGGDGLAVARLLHEWHYPVKVCVVHGGTPTNDFSINEERLKDRVVITEYTPVALSEIIEKSDVLIDAIFGSGLSRPVEGAYAEVIRTVNEADCVRVAVDIPSGLMADVASHGEIVQADYTVSFQLPKLAFFFPSSHKFVGRWEVVNIGLDEGFIKKAPTSLFLLTSKDIRKRLRPRSTFDHKGTYGHALLVTGSKGKMGAAVLSARATLRSGAGLLSVRVPGSGVSIIQTAVPEAMALADPDEQSFSSVPDLESFSAVGVGPGIGQSDVTIKAFGKMMEAFRKPMVIDADGLNILAAHRHLLSLVPEGSILTPHPKEFERIAGSWLNDFERLDKQRVLARQLKSVIVLKGAFTSIVSPENEVYFNCTGNPGMATGGTGDVLTGILTGLLSQGYSSVDAALVGVYLHGLAGDLGAADLGYESLIAGDIVEYLPQAFQRIRNSGKKNRRRF